MGEEEEEEVVFTREEEAIFPHEHAVKMPTKRAQLSRYTRYETPTYTTIR